MPASVTERLLPPAVQDPPRKRWTRAECEVVEATGVFDQQRVELIEGELIDKMGKNRPHVGVAALLSAWLTHVFGGRRVNAEAPIDVAPEDNPTNQPVPDLIVLKREYSVSGFWAATPQPKHLDLVVEIADTSLVFDFTVKGAIYARAGIAEYWILDLQGRRLQVHRDPQGARFTSVTSYGEDESVAPLAAPRSLFQARSVLPPI